MRRFWKTVIVSLTIAATGCIAEQGQVVRDQPPAENYPPPPPGTPDDAYGSAEAPPPAGTDVANADVFYEPLSPYGHWTWVAPYGRVWVPAVAYGWRPYYYGRWVLTDWGWTFVSDDPWGWAAYHYGVWNFGVGVGWYWIPGTVWGPAWVNWRWGYGYVTWCPMGPPGVYYGYGHPAWVAVPQQHFTRPISTVAVPQGRTIGIVSKTLPLTGPHATVARNGAFGPPVATVSRATGQQLRPVAAATVVRPRVSPIQPVARTGMQSPVQPRARVDAPRAGPRAGTYGAAPRPAPSGGVRAAPAPHAPAGGGPRAAPPAGGAAPHSAPAPSGGGHGGGPHATAPKSK